MQSIDDRASTMMTTETNDCCVIFLLFLSFPAAAAAMTSCRLTRIASRYAWLHTTPAHRTLSFYWFVNIMAYMTRMPKYTLNSWYQTAVDIFGKHCYKKDKLKTKCLKWSRYPASVRQQHIQIKRLASLQRRFYLRCTALRCALRYERSLSH